MEQQLQELQEKKVQKEQEFEQLEMEVRQKTEQLRKDKEEVNQQKAPLVNRQQTLKTKVESQKQEIEAIEGKTTKIVSDMETNEQRLAAAQAQLEEAQQENRKHQNAYEQINKELEDTQKASVARINDVRQTEQELKQLKEKQTIMKNSQNESRNRSTVLTSLLQAQERGLLSGIHGRLGDQGSIDQMYDTAISTACNQLDFIVVDSVRDAEACVNYLRENKIGRATFIGLDKMIVYKAQRMKPFQCPQGAKRLFDLVTPKDEKVTDALYFALKDTLVANNIQEGTNIAFNSG